MASMRPCDPSVTQSLPALSPESLGNFRLWPRDLLTSLFFRYTDLSALGRLARVSKGMKAVAEDPCGWKSQLFLKFKEEADPSIHSKIRYQTCMFNWMLRRGDPVTDAKIKKLMGKFLHLTSLQIHHYPLRTTAGPCFVSGGTLLDFAANYPQLRSLSFRSTVFEAFPRIKPSHLCQLVTKLTQLCELTLHGCHRLSRDDFAQVLRALPNLEAFSAESSVLDDALVAQAAALSSLKVLSLGGNARGITNASLDTIGEKCASRLTKLGLCVHTQPFKLNKVESLVPRLTGLREFTFNGCENLNDVAVCTLLKQSPGIRVVTLFNCQYLTVAVIKALAQCDNLAHLALSNCKDPGLFNQAVTESKSCGGFAVLKECDIKGQ